MIKPVIIIAQLFIAFILFLFRILLSIGHVLWKMVIWILLFIWKVFSGLFDLLLRSYGNFSLIVLNFYSETYRVPAIYSKIEGTYLPTMGAYKKKLGDLGNEGTETKNNRKQSPNPVKEHIIQTDENRKRLYRRLAVFLVFTFTIIASISVTFYQQNSSIKAKEAKVKDMKKNWIH